MPRGPEYERLLQRLKEEVEKARHDFEICKRDFDRNSTEAHSIGLNSPDGSHLLNSTAKRYNQAVKEYSDALRRYADVLLRFEAPRQ